MITFYVCARLMPSWKGYETTTTGTHLITSIHSTGVFSQQVNEAFQLATLHTHKQGLLKNNNCQNEGTWIQYASFNFIQSLLCSQLVWVIHQYNSRHDRRILIICNPWIYTLVPLARHAKGTRLARIAITATTSNATNHIGHPPVALRTPRN